MLDLHLDACRNMVWLYKLAPCITVSLSDLTYSTVMCPIPVRPRGIMLHGCCGILSFYPAGLKEPWELSQHPTDWLNGLWLSSGTDLMDEHQRVARQLPHQALEDVVASTRRNQAIAIGNTTELAQRQDNGSCLGTKLLLTQHPAWRSPPSSPIRQCSTQ